MNARAHTGNHVASKVIYKYRSGHCSEIPRVCVCEDASAEKSGAQPISQLFAYSLLVYGSAH